MNVSLAIAAGIMYGISSIGAGYTALTLFGPLPICFVLGVVSGQMATAMALGAAIQSIYLGLIAPGGNTPADANLATCVGASIALLGNLDYNTAVTLAVPVGLLGALLTIVKYIIAGMFVDPAEEAAAACD
ncbi:MAG: PTS sugar transporter subunit IIC, partial [Atopobiaceae bacterium]|nr:PTS sugar transporter subunit IIC [Atopobiaceae bacterium]